MERNHSKTAVVNLALLLLAALVSYGVARYVGTLAGQVSAAFLGLGVLVAAVSAFQMRMEERERLEKLEFDEVTRGSSSTLFNATEADAFHARRAREQFEKFFVPGFTVLLCLLEAGGAWWIWRALQKSAGPKLQQPLVGLGLYGVLFLVLFLLGRYSAKLAQLEGSRLLRPGANFMLLGAYLSSVTAVAILGVFAELSRMDWIVAQVLSALLALLAAETLLTLVFEIYRPRTRGVVVRLLYDSRLVGLGSHPEGIFTTAAHALDYQFGFKVSETWFYQFAQRAFGWLLLAQLAVLLLSTSFVFIEAGEEALLERFGKPVSGRATLGPGVHLKLPWPIDRAHRFRTEQVQTFTVGVEVDPERETEKTVLWTVAHYKEEFNFLVASREDASLTLTNADSSRKSPPVSLLSGSVSFQYQINDLPAWAYNYTDAGALLKKIATREVVRYLVSADLNEVMSWGRVTAAQQLSARIQEGADALKLGVKILFVGLQDIHPPVAVAGAYEEVVGAGNKARAKVLVAEAHGIQTNLYSRAEAFRREVEADALRQRAESGAAARAALFTNQLPAFRASPTVYAQRAYLQTFARASAKARKIVLGVTNTQDVILLDLEEKIGQGLLDLPMPTLDK